MAALSNHKLKAGSQKKVFKSQFPVSFSKQVFFSTLKGPVNSWTCSQRKCFQQTIIEAKQLPIIFGVANHDCFFHDHTWRIPRHPRIVCDAILLLFVGLKLIICRGSTACRFQVLEDLRGLHLFCPLNTYRSTWLDDARVIVIFKTSINASIERYPGTPCNNLSQTLMLQLCLHQMDSESYQLDLH